METVISTAAPIPRKFFRKYLPSHETVRGNRHIARFGGFLQQANLWHLNRHSVAGNVAVGMYSGLVPGPQQMLTAALGLAAPGYACVQIGWRAQVIRAWRKRRELRSRHAG
jgi:uncharacterized protein (DUF2062 family)